MFSNKRICLLIKHVNIYGHMLNIFVVEAICDFEVTTCDPHTCDYFHGNSTDFASRRVRENTMRALDKFMFFYMVLIHFDVVARLVVCSMMLAIRQMVIDLLWKGKFLPTAANA